MSGIVGIFRADGAPVDAALARALTRSLASRGPDARDTWCSGSVALGHAMLRSTEEPLGQIQPVDLDGRFWIAADARIDGREELCTSLRRAGSAPAGNAPDSLLILHAYAAWGEQCLQHIRGDFAFGIWDVRRKTLFCARDHLGIKPFYFAERKDFFLFSNTLDCVRAHPAVPDDLNEAAIADFLLFGLNCDPAATTFRAIRRLPPAHFLRVSADGLRMLRYWSFPVDGHIRYNHRAEYVEHFQARLRAAVQDRLRGARVGIMLSGGLDSSSLAATARELTPERGEAGKLRAYTATHEQTLKERDGEHAREVAAFLDIPHRCLAMDHLRPFERWGDPEMHWPEPVDDPLIAGSFDQMGAVSAECRAVFNGEGPDNLMLFQMLPYIRDLLRRREWGRLCADVPGFLRVRRIPWRGIRQRLKGAMGVDSGMPRFPQWLNPDFAKRVDAKQRWRAGGVPPVAPAHPVRPRAHASMSLPHWTLLFESLDPGVTRHPVEVRYPFLDLRIIDYLLAIPPFPWAFEKTLLRAAMAGHLPEKVRRRPKTPLPGEPLNAALPKDGGMPSSQVAWTAEIGRFISPSVYRIPRAEQSGEAVEMGMRPLCLNFWLQHTSSLRYNLTAEAGNG